MTRRGRVVINRYSASNSTCQEGRECLRGVACITKLVGSAFRSRIAGRGMFKKGKEREKLHNKRKKSVLFLFLPHPAPGCPGPWWIEPGTSVRTRCRRWVTQKGKGEEPRAQSAGTIAFVGRGGKVSYWTDVMLFVDGHIPTCTACGCRYPLRVYGN